MSARTVWLIILICSIINIIISLLTMFGIKP